MIPTVQFYSTNPRNSAINIRGLGAPFGLTNDGIEPGVGLYIDGVFYARPAAATLDFLDVERSRCCADRRARCSARTRPPARSTSRRASRRSRRESDVELNFGDSRIRAGEGARSPGRSASKWPAACRSPARSATASSSTSTTQQRRERSQQPRRQRAGAVRAVGPARRSRSPSITRGSARRATRRSSPASRRRCASRTGSTRRSPPISTTRRRASTPSIGSPTSTRRCARTRISAAHR